MMTHVQLLHTHCVEEMPKEFMSVLLLEIVVLVIFSSDRVQKIPVNLIQVSTE